MVCKHFEYDTCLPCFVAFHEIQIVEKDYCILLQVGTENWFTNISRNTASVFTPCLFSLHQVYEYRYSGSYKNKALIIPFDKDYTEYSEKIWPGIKRKAIELLKDPNIKKQFLAHRLK